MRIFVNYTINMSYYNYFMAKKKQKLMGIVIFSWFIFGVITKIIKFMSNFLNFLCLVNFKFDLLNNKIIMIVCLLW